MGERPGYWHPPGGLLAIAVVLSLLVVLVVVRAALVAGERGIRNSIGSNRITDGGSNISIHIYQYLFQTYPNV